MRTLSFDDAKNAIASFITMDTQLFHSSANVFRLVKPFVSCHQEIFCSRCDVGSMEGPCNQHEIHFGDKVKPKQSPLFTTISIVPGCHLFPLYNHMFESFHDFWPVFHRIRRAALNQRRQLKDPLTN